MSSWDAARALLDARLLTLAGIDPTKIHWPNRGFTKPTSGGFWKVNFIPSAVDPEFSGSAHEKGIYQVSRFEPTGTDFGPVTQAIDSICALFDRVSLGTAPKVFCGVPIPGPYIQEANYIHLPVSIPFQVL